ncbi:unnamed protein product [Malus baccata var. baccata]
MEEVNVTLISELRLYTKAEKIKACVCRIWKSKHAVEGSTSDIDCEIVASKIEPGGQYNVVQHDNQLIFSGITAFKKLSNVFPPIPQHRFFLQDYNTLYSRLNNVDILTGDIIIHGMDIYILKTLCHWSSHCTTTFGTKQINQRLAYKCDVHIQNKGTTHYYTMGRCCRGFLFFICGNTTSFNCRCIYKFKSQALYRYKVNLVLEDDTNKINDLVLNQRLVDQQLLPNEFLRLIGQKKNFHLRFGNRRNSLNSSDILIYNVSEDTTKEPITPQPLIQEVTVSSTTILSSTSIAETSGPSYKRKRVHQESSLYR